jgi:glycosyltransferase involved in cell wall biosynthesis
MLSARFDRHVPAYEKMEGVPVYRFVAPSNYRLAHLLFNLQCAQWLLRNPDACDIIQFAYMPVYWLPIQIVAGLIRKPIFIQMTLFGSSDLASIGRSPRSFFLMRSYQRVRGILALTSKIVDVSMEYLRDPSIIHLIPYPVDTSIFHPPADVKEKAKLRKKVGAGTDERIAIFVGAVIERKGIDLLVEAWPTVMNALPRVRLYVVGPRIFSKEFGYDNVDFNRRIDKRIEELGISESLVFTGDQNDHVPDYLRMADVFVLPTRNEGLANAILEAMASGLPCVVCRQPWLPNDLIYHGKSGLVCEPTPESLAKALIHILGSSEIAAKMGLAAYETASKEYAPDVISEKLIQTYRKALEE